MQINRLTTLFCLIFMMMSNAHVKAEEKAVIDVMVVYTQAASEIVPSIEMDIQMAVENTNQAFENSAVHASLRLVHMQQIDYVESDDFRHNLGNLRNPLSTSELREVHQLRDTYAADIVILWVASDRYVECALAPIMTKSLMSTAFAPYAFGVVRADCATAPRYAFTHTIGHLMGADHDYYAHSNDGILPDSYAYIHQDDFQSGWRTVMAAMPMGSNTRILLFSNPDILYQGEPTGDANSNNARTLNMTAPIVASFRQGSVIAVSPDGSISASVTEENNIRLRDSSTGNEISTILTSASTPRALAFSADGGLLAVGYQNGMLHVFDTRSGQEIQAFAGHRSMVKAIAISADASVMASISADSTVKKWDMLTGEEDDFKAESDGGDPSPQPTGCDQAARINPDLSLHIPCALYQPPLGDAQNLWVDLVPGCPQGVMCWSLRDYGVNR